MRAREWRLADYFRRADPAAWRGKRCRQTDSRTHVFLVGFPRSGTTLLEQVLASHPDVAAMEERTCLMDSAAAFFGSDADLDRLAALSDAELEPWRAGLLEAGGGEPSWRHPSRSLSTRCRSMRCSCR